MTCTGVCGRCPRARAALEASHAAFLAENLTLKSLQAMSMNQRRHATIILFGDSYQTFTPLQAFQQSGVLGILAAQASHFIGHGCYHLLQRYVLLRQVRVVLHAF